MTHAGESIQEASPPTSLLTTKAKTRIGTWNIRTLYESGKSAQVAREIKDTTLTFWDYARPDGMGAARPNCIQEKPSSTPDIKTWNMITIKESH
ncbi:hypothetical protein DPMN_064079 [Dreissena polymorpha]|uniref:Uncharacterized protein n=1 Tax=Dreissena polymorpha TaxID=45954 RepID=A0A9D4CCJ4_DREPO|nr:hypothetical protein DPMN_064079 [Dreissena polymorpha]